MTIADSPQPLIECSPWCTHGDGHPDQYFASDQTCYGEWHTTPALGGSDDVLNVLAHRRGGGGVPDVCLNVFVREYDLDVYLTAGQARLLAESLMTVADQIEEPDSPV